MCFNFSLEILDLCFTDYQILEEIFNISEAIYRSSIIQEH